MTSVTDRPRPRLSRKQLRQRLRTARRQQARKARARTAAARTDSRPTSQAGPHHLRPPRAGVLAADPSSIRPPGPGRDPHPGRTHDHQPAPRPGRPGSRTPQQLSPGLLARPLVALGPGTPLCRGGPRPLRAAWPDPPGRRRHGHRTSRSARLRQGPPSRSGPLHSHLHRVSLGT